MRGIIINPFKKEVMVTYDDFEQPNILNYHLQTTAQSVIPLEGKNHLFLDMGGPFRQKQGWWGFQGYPDMVCAGKGLILGLVPSNDQGRIVPPDADLEKLKGMVEWVDEEEAHRRLEGKVEPNLLGSQPRLHIDRCGNCSTTLQ